jgi:hypothetical protein
MPFIFSPFSSLAKQKPLRLLSGKQKSPSSAAHTTDERLRHPSVFRGNIASDYLLIFM